MMTEVAPHDVREHARLLLGLQNATDELACRVELRERAAGRDQGLAIVGFTSATYVVAVALDPDSRRATGQLWPPQPGHVVAVSPQGRGTRLAVGGDGCFSLPSVPRGPVQLVIEPLSPSAPSVRTEWTMIAPAGGDTDGAPERAAEPTCRSRHQRQASASAGAPSSPSGFAIETAPRRPCRALIDANPPSHDRDG
jgi:hypothetical protein